MTERDLSAEAASPGLIASIAAAEAVPVQRNAAALAAVLEMLRHLALEPRLLSRAEAYLQRLLLTGFEASGDLLERLLAEPGTAILSAPMQRCLELLRALSRQDLAQAGALLGTLDLGSCPPLGRMLASHLHLNAGRPSEALQLLAALPEDWNDAALQAGHLRAWLHRRALSRLAPPPAGDRVFLTLCSALRDEARYLAEWVVHHALLGVDRFCLYDNDSRDETRAILSGLQRHFDIEIRPWDQQPANVLAFDDCYRREVGRTEWLACVDSDEFLMPGEGESLPALLREAGTAAALLVNWRIFGSSGLDRRPPGLCLAHFTGRAPDDFPPNRHIKSIVRPECVVALLTPHHFAVLGRQVDSEMRAVLPVAGRLERPRLRRLALHHYIVRSREDFRHKIARGRGSASRNSIGQDFKGYFEFHDRNEVEDRSAWRFVPAVEQRLRSLAAAAPASSDSAHRPMTPD
jgi:hypothetical protein